MKTWQVLLLGVLFGLIASAVLLVIISAPRGEAVRLLPPPTPAPLVVHVTGAVTHPGVYTLPVGSRVQDAVDAAGGFLPSANQGSVNLAAPMTDGQKIGIPSQNDPTPAVTTVSKASPILKDTLSSAATPAGIIDINQATVEQLDTLPGIGEQKAAAIIAYREQHGTFQTIEDIQNVTGIGPSIFERIKDLICAQNCSS